jgi:hypothetical protein
MWRPFGANATEFTANPIRPAQFKLCRRGFSCENRSSARRVDDLLG